MMKASKAKIVKTLKTNVTMFNRWRRLFKVETVYLRRANIGLVDLRGADLRRANLCDANLTGASLCDANLYGANLSTIKTDGTGFFDLQCPDTGSFIGWKKCVGGVVVKLLVPAEAKRSSATSRKCRAEFVDVLEVKGAEIGFSMHNKKTTYKVGRRVVCNKWCEDRWIECDGGIHFFMTREEAEKYNSYS